MKAKIIGKGEIELPDFFSEKIREDIAQKFYEAEKKIQPYGSNPEAGKHHSASGKMSHSRRKWRTSYGHGMSRVPRKILWRRGDHFYWIGAEVSGTRGGRRAHPPKPSYFQKDKKINKKEKIIALHSAFASTANINFLKRRYSSINEKINLPIIISGDELKLKTKEFFKFLEKNLGNAFEIALKKKTQRAGKGKARNRRYKENAGLLLVLGEKEEKKISGIEAKKIGELEISDLFPLGRLTCYTENAIKELGEVRK
ncbi:50S ribosomal protein L4 [Candidatus Pacearchaeota archaeon]|nr:50S ribosomal protein L4 [Candidatus Pacearchaeota archaeon]